MLELGHESLAATKDYLADAITIAGTCHWATKLAISSEPPTTAVDGANSYEVPSQAPSRLATNREVAPSR